MRVAPPGPPWSKASPKSLAKKTVAMKWNGVLSDLSDPLEEDGKIEFVMRDSADGLGLIRHDAAHVLAEAVQELWPETQVTIGPVIENGFYYDFKRDAVQRGRLSRPSRRRWPRSSRAGRRFTKEVWSRDEAKRVFRQGRGLQGRAGRCHSG
jgi:threonyl-tRNA synthetase